MYCCKHRYRNRGFSLIEVLIAMVVLSVGLLALASLQVQIMRTSADTKSKSGGLSLAQQKIEELRGFVSSDEYKAINSSSYVSNVTEMTDAAAGGTSFTRSWTVKRYVLDRSTGAFVDVGASNVTASDTQLTAFNTKLVPGTEFKKLEVTVGWIDALGASQSVTLSDVIDALDPNDSIHALEATNLYPRDAQARIYDPGSQPGVIPIAVGNDQSVASSDPKPVQEGKHGMITTRFNVESYVKDGNDAIIKKNIETALVSCRCTTTVQSNDEAPPEGPFAASYWDGDKFTVPKSIAGKTRGYLDSSIDQNVNLCSVCCRDHHDKASESIKYDPYRPPSDISNGDHNHYHNTNPTGTPAFTVVGPNNAFYDEACRLVRVDGIFRVTTDPRLENLAMLNMLGSPASAATLTQATITAYADFAKNYVTAIWGAVKTGVEQKALADYTPTPSGLGQADPADLAVASKFNLSSRAVFVDWLSPEAINKLNCVGTDATNVDCATKYSNYQTSSILQIVPFFAINLTNIGEWSENSASKILTVANEAIPNNVSTTFTRGEVTGVKAGSAQTSVNSYRGASGLTDQVPIDPDDAGIAVTTRAPPLAIARNFTVTGASSTTVEYVVEIIDLSNDGGNFLTAQLNVVPCTRGTGAGQSKDPTDGSKLDTNEHLCSLTSSVTTATLTFNNYNRVTNVVCPSGSKGNNYSAITGVFPPQCQGSKNNDIVSATSYTVRDYKLCPIPVTSGVTFANPIESNSSASNPQDPTLEATMVGLTLAPNAAVLDLKRLSARFVKQSAACP